MAYAHERFLPPGWRNLRGQEYRDAHVKARAALLAHRAQRKIEIVAEKAAKAATQMTCQICGRGIFAEAGVIAHHGYERPFEGYQTASCPGARKLPFEVDRSLLAREIALLEDALHDAGRRVAEVEAETTPLHVTWEIGEENPQWRALPSKRRFLDRYVKVSREVTRETYAAVEAEHKASNRHGPFQTLSYGGFDAIKQSALRKAQGRHAQLLATLQAQQARYDGWKQTHRAGEPGEAVWVAL